VRKCPSVFQFSPRKCRPRSGESYHTRSNRLIPGGRRKRVTGKCTSLNSFLPERIHVSASPEEMKDDPGQHWFDFDASPPKRRRKPKSPQEFKIISIRDSAETTKKWLCEIPDHAVEYWRAHVATAPWYSPDRECSVVIMLNARSRIIGHHLVSIGLLDSAVMHPREAFRAAIIGNAHSVVFGHNHPSGDPTPSHADVAATRELVRAGEHLRIRVIDHIIMGSPSFSSLRQLGMME
jgi:hypothetical protein